MKELPYYRMWVKDFDTNENVRLLNLPEVGLYLLCLNHAWINEGLPGTPGDISRALKIPEREFAKYWSRVACCFQLENDGRFRNNRQEEEREHAAQKSIRSSNAVSERERKRALRSSNDTSDDDPRARARPGSDSGSSEEKSRKDCEMRREFDEQFQEFESLYGKTGKALISEDFTEAWWEWKVLDGEQRMAANASLRARLAAGIDDPEWLKKPANFLKSREFKREIRRPSNKSNGMTAKEIAAL